MTSLPEYTDHAAINRPAVVADVRAAFERYEAALVAAVVTMLFDYPNRPIEGRQTQIWVRFPDGWRIVSAHVSEVPAS